MNILLFDNYKVDYPWHFAMEYTWLDLHYRVDLNFDSLVK